PFWLKPVDYSDFPAILSYRFTGELCWASAQAGRQTAPRMAGEPHRAPRGPPAPRPRPAWPPLLTDVGAQPAQPQDDHLHLWAAMRDDSRHGVHPSGGEGLHSWPAVPASAASVLAARPGLPPDHAAAPAPRRAQGRQGAASCGAQAPLAELVRHHSLPEVDHEHERRADQDVTTMAIVNLPYSYPQWMLQRDIDQEGLAYDYFHVPHDNRLTRNRGFAFVNFLTPEAADTFKRSFNSREFSSPAAESKVVTVLPSRLQGFEANASLHPGGVVQKPQLQLRKHQQPQYQQLRQEQQQQTTASGSGSSRGCHAAVPAAIGRSAGSSSSSSDVPMFVRISL
ncbi:unnamed protein product, partial [Prorocentrum cordatum]